jgi:hypothetical protein
MITHPNRIESHLFSGPCHRHVLRPSDYPLDFRQLNTNAKEAHSQQPAGAAGQ